MLPHSRKNCSNESASSAITAAQSRSHSGAHRRIRSRSRYAPPASDAPASAMLERLRSPSPCPGISVPRVSVSARDQEPSSSPSTTTRYRTGLSAAPSRPSSRRYRTPGPSTQGHPRRKASRTRVQPVPRRYRTCRLSAEAPAPRSSVLPPFQQLPLGDVDDDTPARVARSLARPRRLQPRIAVSSPILELGQQPLIAEVQQLHPETKPAGSNAVLEALGVGHQSLPVQLLASEP